MAQLGVHKCRVSGGLALSSSGQRNDLTTPPPYVRGAPPARALVFCGGAVNLFPHGARIFVLATDAERVRVVM